MKVLVTGGSGYIGSHAVYLLIEKGYDVVIVDNLSTGFELNAHPEAKFYNIDINNESKLNEVFEKEKNIKAIMHFAGSISVAESVNEPLKYFNNNVSAFITLLKVASKHNIKNIIFSSTAAVYGEPKSVPILEDDIKIPVNPYGESKLSAEYLLKSWSKSNNSNYVIFRYFNVAGAHESGKIGIRGKELTHLLPCVIRSALDTNIVFKVFGTDYKTNDGSAIRDFVHVNDLVEAHILGLEWSIKNNKSEIFNLGSNKGYSVLEVLNQASKTLNIVIPFSIEQRRIGDPSILTASNKKSLEILLWKPKYSLDEIIKSEFNFRKNKI